MQLHYTAAGLPWLMATAMGTCRPTFTPVARGQPTDRGCPTAGNDTETPAAASGSKCDCDKRKFVHPEAFGARLRRGCLDERK